MRDREKNWPRQFSGRRRLSLINYFCPRGSRQRPSDNKAVATVRLMDRSTASARFRFSDSSIRVLRLYARMRTDSVMTAASLRRRTHARMCAIGESLQMTTPFRGFVLRCTPSTCLQSYRLASAIGNTQGCSPKKKWGDA